MTTATPQPGRKGEVAISNASSADYTSATYVDIERLRNPKLAQSKKEADISSNDSGGDEEHIVTWRSGMLTFDFIAAWTATGQTHVIASYDASDTRAFRYCPLGAVSTEPRWRFLGTVDFDNTNPVQDGGVISASVKRTGGFTRDTNP